MQLYTVRLYMHHHLSLKHMSIPLHNSFTNNLNYTCQVYFFLSSTVVKLLLGNLAKNSSFQRYYLNDLHSTINLANIFCVQQLFNACFYCYINRIFSYDTKKQSNEPNRTSITRHTDKQQPYIVRIVKMSRPSSFLCNTNAFCGRMKINSTLF